MKLLSIRQVDGNNFILKWICAQIVDNVDKTEESQERPSTGPLWRVTPI